MFASTQFSPLCGALVDSPIVAVAADCTYAVQGGSGDSKPGLATTFGPKLASHGAPTSMTSGETVASLASIASGIDTVSAAASAPCASVASGASMVTSLDPSDASVFTVSA